MMLTGSFAHVEARKSAVNVKLVSTPLHLGHFRHELLVLLLDHGSHSPLRKPSGSPNTALDIPP